MTRNADSIGTRTCRPARSQEYHGPRVVLVVVLAMVGGNDHGAAQTRRWCADAGRPTRFKPSRPSPPDAVRDGSAKLGHPVQNVTREHGLTPLPR